MKLPTSKELESCRLNQLVQLELRLKNVMKRKRDIVEKKKNDKVIKSLTKFSIPELRKLINETKKKL